MQKATVCTTSLGSLFGKQQLYLERRELIYKATVCTSSIGMPLERDCL